MSRNRKILFVAIVIAINVFAIEALSRVAIRKLGWERIRQLMAGEVRQGAEFQHAIGQAYLLYVPAPGYGENNSQGYRGRAVEFKRTPGIVRVLCLGGSTTYGWGENDAKGTYPAYLEKVLAEKLPAGVKGVEVINAGAPWATTAEVLNYYHFKFHYYRPDIVVINVGGNDATGMVLSHYHPDYSHWRRPMTEPKPLSYVGQKLLKSRFMALVLIPLIEGRYPDAETFVKLDNQPPVVSWYPELPRDPKTGVPQLPEDDDAFKYNLETLVRQIQADGAKVVLVPFRRAPNDKYGVTAHAAMDKEEAFVKAAAKKFNTALAPFPASVVTPSSWVDDCHTTSQGYYDKAKHVAEYVVPYLSVKK